MPFSSKHLIRNNVINFYCSQIIFQRIPNFKFTPLLKEKKGQSAAFESQVFVGYCFISKIQLVV